MCAVISHFILQIQSVKSINMCGNIGLYVYESVKLHPIDCVLFVDHLFVELKTHNSQGISKAVENYRYCKHEIKYQYNLEEYLQLMSWKITNAVSLTY